MKRTSLAAKDVNRLMSQYKDQVQFTKKDHLELRETDEYRVILANKELAFFYYGEQIVPTLRYLQRMPAPLLKAVTVDMGAVKFIINGADVMRPGIVELDETIAKDEIVVVVDKNNRKPLTVGMALFPGQDIKSMSTGKVIKNIHYVGDELWNLAI